jgi:hypothetical protein
MNDLRDRLQDADPVAREAPLAEHDAQQMRRAIVTAADAHGSSSVSWRRTSWATASVVIAISVAIGISRWREPREVTPVNTVREVPASRARESRRQLQLITPGGTRVIWVFNEDFKP